MSGPGAALASRIPSLHYVIHHSRLPFIPYQRIVWGPGCTSTRKMAKGTDEPEDLEETEETDKTEETEEADERGETEEMEDKEDMVDTEASRSAICDLRVIADPRARSPHPGARSVRQDPNRR